MPKKKIVLVATHPIQYHVPWFRALEKEDGYSLTVLFGMLLDSKQQSTGFDHEFTWDIPLLEGYQYRVLENTSSNPGIEHFNGISCPNIRDVVKELNPDVIIITGWQSKMLLQAIRAAKNENIKIIMRGESNAMRRRAFYKNVLHRILLRRIDAFLAIGSGNKAFYIKNGVNRQQIFDAPYFVENERFLASSHRRDDDKIRLRQEFYIDPSAFCFVYSGKLIEKKNVKELLKAFQEIYHNHKNIHLLIIGDGQYKNTLEDYAIRYKLPVTFAGFVNQTQIPDIYSIGNCFLLASDYGETWGLVVNEAMLSGMPAIISDRVGCGPDLIISNKTGFIYPYGNTAKLAENMTFMVQNPDVAKRMGEYARRLVAKRFNVEQTVMSTIHAIEQLN